ncbi:MAG: nuclear transport factor 2 family protein [Acidobacteriota bacterium]
MRAVLEKWPRDFAARDGAAVCGLFAPDSLIIYQNAPDKNYEALCSQLTRVVKDTERKYLYDAPDIKEILVAGDLATVRLIWTARVTKRGETGELVERENGVDVFKRQLDGSWKIYISHAFAEPTSDGK